MNTMRARMFHKLVSDAGLIADDFSFDDTVRVLEEAKPHHCPRMSRQQFDEALVLVCARKFHSMQTSDAVAYMFEHHIVPLDRGNFSGDADYLGSIQHPQVVDIAYEYDDFVRFIYFYYTQQAQLMSFDDFMLFAEDFGVAPMQINPNELGLIFQSAGSVVRGGCLSYHEFVVCLSRCALRAGGSSATRAVNDFFERVVASDAYAGIERWHRSLEWAPHAHASISSHRAPQAEPPHAGAPAQGMHRAASDAASGSQHAPAQLALMHRGPMRASERLHNGRISPRRVS